VSLSHPSLKESHAAGVVICCWQEAFDLQVSADAIATP